MHKLLLLGLLGILMGCSLSGDDDVVISTVQPGLRVDLSHPLDLAPQFALNFVTTDETCGSAKLIADGIVMEDNVHIEISGLLVPAVCDVDRGLISKEIPVGITPGTYSVRIEIGQELSNRGELTFDGEEYQLSIIDPHGLYIGHDKLYRIPEQIVWGEIRSDTNIPDIIDEFNEAAAAVTSSLNLKDGYYGHFAVENGSEINLSALTTESNSYNYPFVLRLSSGTDEFRQMLNTIRGAHPNLIEINCTTWTGEQL